VRAGARHLLRGMVQIPLRDSAGLGTESEPELRGGE
jgi:hypothetical protein